MYGYGFDIVVIVAFNLRRGIHVFISQADHSTGKLIPKWSQLDVHERPHRKFVNPFLQDK